MRAMPVCIGGNSPVSRKVLAIDPMLQIPQPDVLEEHTHRRQPAQHGATPTIEQTEPQEIHAEEARGRPHQNIREVRSAAALGQFFRAPGGVAIQLFEVMRQIAIGHVHQRGAQAPDVGTVHEHLERGADVGRLRAPLVHVPYRDLSHHLEKLDRYATWSAEELAERGRRAHLTDILVRPPARFFSMYFLRLGLLDGWRGAVLCGLAAVSVFLKYVRLWDLQHRVDG